MNFCVETYSGSQFFLIFVHFKENPSPIHMRHGADTFASLYDARLVFVAESPFAAMYRESRDMLLKIVA